MTAVNVVFPVLLLAHLVVAKYNFSYNECVYNKYITRCIGQGNQLHKLNSGITEFPALKYNEECLVLTDNQIRTFPNDLSPYAGLLTLNVARNLISDLPDDLDTLNKLKILDLTGNKVSNISPTVRFPSTLEALILKQNSLRTLPDGLQIPTLFVLDLSENHFTDIPREFCVSRQLIRVDLTQNSQLGDISKYVDVLNDCSNLNEIPFCLFTDSDYISCDCPTLGSLLLREPVFHVSTRRYSSPMQCSQTSEETAFSGVKLFDIDVESAGTTCPAERLKNQKTAGGHSGNSLSNKNDGRVLNIMSVFALYILLKQVPEKL